MRVISSMNAVDSGPSMDQWIWLNLELTFGSDPATNTYALPALCSLVAACVLYDIT